jgi:hypothetical protein
VDCLLLTDRTHEINQQLKQMRLLLLSSSSSPSGERQEVAGRVGEQSTWEPPYPTRVFFIRGWGWEDFDFRSWVTLPRKRREDVGAEIRRDLYLNIGNPIFVLGSSGPHRPVCFRVQSSYRITVPGACAAWLPLFSSKREKKRKPYQVLPVLCSSAVAPVSVVLGYLDGVVE